MSVTSIIVTILAIAFLIYLVKSKDRRVIDKTLPMDEKVKPNEFKKSSLNEYWLVDNEITGKGLSILVIDWNYEKLSEKIARVLKYKTINVGKLAPRHASIIIDILTAKRDSKGYDGLLPDADIYFTNPLGDVVETNLIVGSIGMPSKMYPVFEEKLLKLSKKGLVVFASGNYGRGYVVKPITYPYALIVGAANGNSLKPYTAATPAVDVVDDDAVYDIKDYDKVVVGTSFSAPIVAGKLGKILTLNKDIKPEELIYLSNMTAIKMKNTRYNKIGYNGIGGGWGKFNYEKVKEAVLNNSYKKFYLTSMRFNSSGVIDKEIYKIIITCDKDTIITNLDGIRYISRVVANEDGSYTHTLSGYMGQRGNFKIETECSYSNVEVLLINEK